MEEIKDKWDLATNGVCDADVSNKWWTIIKDRFASKDRIYHNHNYIISLFKLFHEHREQMTNPQAVALSIFFHKLEFDPRSGDGDARSLEQFTKFVSEGSHKEQSSISSATEVLLEACASNLTEAHMTVGGAGTEDQHYLLDMCVAVLGAPRPLYEDYTVRVQAEYRHLSPQAYSQLRLKILQSLLLMPNVYATKDFQDLYEKPARENIAVEIEKLKKTT